MKRYLIVLLAVLAVAAWTMPAFATPEFKYGGYWRVRWMGSDNLTDGQSSVNGRNGIPSYFNDGTQRFDQRLRLYFTFIASENLQLVTKWEVNTIWGQQASGGDTGADSNNFLMKNVYIDFNVPYTPVRAKIGVQGIALFDGWIVDDDFSAVRLSTQFDPVQIEMGYIAAQNEDVNGWSDNIDDFYGQISATYGPFSGKLIAFWQHGNQTDVSGLVESKADFYGNPQSQFAAGPQVHGNDLVDLGVNLAYKMDWLDAKVTYVQNLGSYQRSGLNHDTEYRGWMVDAAANAYYGDFTFSLGGFVTSGDRVVTGADLDGGVAAINPATGRAVGTGNIYFGHGHTDSMFRYPAGRSHYWSEIMGLGTFDYAAPDQFGTGFGAGADAGGAGGSNLRQYVSGDNPSNIWTLNASVAWQILAGTKATLGYYYIGTVTPVISDWNRWQIIPPAVPGAAPGYRWVPRKSNSLGHEIDFYLDQDVVDGLKLRFVAAYLIAEPGLSIYSGDDNIYEVGARLSWSF
jgi:hypothetical protein